MSELTPIELETALLNITNTMNDTYRVYGINDVPRRFHYRANKNRIGDVIVDSSIGYSVLASKT
jgi:hypothetical protein